MAELWANARTLRSEAEQTELKSQPTSIKMNESLTLSLPTLSENDFPIWKSTIMADAEEHDLLKYLTQDVEEPATAPDSRNHAGTMAK